MAQKENNGKRFQWIGTNVRRYNDLELAEAEKCIHSKWSWQQAIVQMQCHINRLEKEIAELKKGK